MDTVTRRLCDLTTLKVGGEATVVTIDSEETLQAAVAGLAEAEQSWRVLGGGSNVLAPDAGVDDVVFRMNITGRDMQSVDDTVFLTVGAGETLDDVVADTVHEGWWGIENLSHIPGTVGAVPIQNVGAYGVEAKDVVESVRVYDTQLGQFLDLSAAQCQFGYRDSIFKHDAGKQYVVTAVTFRLTSMPQPRLEYRDLAKRFADTVPTQVAVRDAVIDIRGKKFPDWHTVGTAGSFFKNPIISATHFHTLQKNHTDMPGFTLPDGRVKVPLGWILDNVLSLRGAGTATVGLHQDQALVLINRGGATAAEITAFAESVIEKVKAATHIVVEWEVTRW